MKTRFTLALLAGVGLAALAACSASDEDDDTEEVDGTDDELKALELACASGATKFNLKSNKGSLDTGAFKTSFTCAAPKKVDAGKDAVLACTEGAQKVHAGKWTATVSQSAGTYQATIKRGAAGDLTLSCSVIAKADAGPPPANGGGAGVPTYAEVAPIVASTCGPCHGGAMSTLDNLKKRKNQMLDALSQGRMPKNNPAWHLSEDGKKLINFLQNSKEL